MKVKKKDLELQKAITREWMITNGIGGYASSTILNCNTRKYHGLLVAPLTPPARRFLILSKLDESIKIKDKTYDLYTNMCPNYISKGYQYLESFEKTYIPIFTYQVEGVKLKKQICMQHEHNTVCVQYQIKNGNNDSKLTIAPVMNFRDFHQLKTNHEFEVRQEVTSAKVKLVIDGHPETPIYMNMTSGNYIQHRQDTFRNMYYIEEEKRGFYPEENHCVVGRYEVNLKPNEEKKITFVCSLEDNIDELDSDKVISDEIKRLNKIVEQTELEKQASSKEELEWLRDFIIATDQFIVHRASSRLHTMIAGYPWFLDWGRDALISFEGILLKTKRYHLAKEILRTFTRDIKFGLVPNGYSGFDNRPLYNSVDASLLLFEQVKKYLEYTGDDEFVKQEMYPVMQTIIQCYKKGIDLDDNNIYLDKDYLLVSGTENTQNTWMDAKYGNFAVTPRNGKAVEINAMWYNALKIMEELTAKIETKGKAKKYANLASKCKDSFLEKFYDPKKKCLQDVIGDNKIRPNQLFSLSLAYPIVDVTSEIAIEIIKTTKKKLYNKYGLKTLAKGEKDYIEVYEGNGFKRDMSYHQGITWPWLLGIYYNALKNIEKKIKDKQIKLNIQNEISELVNNTKKIFKKDFYERGMIGSISELYDSKTPFLPKGAPAQCWSIAEVLRIILEKKG